MRDFEAYLEGQEKKENKNDYVSYFKRY